MSCISQFSSVHTTTVTGNTADSTVVQMLITASLNKEAKPKKVQAEWLAVHRELFTDRTASHSPWFWRKSGKAVEEIFGPRTLNIPSCQLVLMVAGSLCFIWSQYIHLPGHFRPCHDSLCLQALWRWTFPFPAGCSTCIQLPQHSLLTIILLNPWKISGLLSRGK